VRECHERDGATDGQRWETTAWPSPGEWCCASTMLCAQAQAGRG
jgi:hypothetical protein